MEHNGIPADAIEAQLCKILASRMFNKADRASRFLRFVVRHSLEGKASELKEYVVGVEVLGRTPDFDPRVDTIVRAEAKRLRSRLDEYYASVGKHDSIRISIPKGTYVPASTGTAHRRTMCLPRSRSDRRGDTCFGWHPLWR
jgi:hypothetical protein